MRVTGARESRRTSEHLLTASFCCELLDGWAILAVRFAETYKSAGQLPLFGGKGGSECQTLMIWRESVSASCRRS